MDASADVEATKISAPKRAKQDYEQVNWREQWCDMVKDFVRGSQHQHTSWQQCMTPEIGHTYHGALG